MQRVLRRVRWVWACALLMGAVCSAHGLQDPSATWDEEKPVSNLPDAPQPQDNGSPSIPATPGPQTNSVGPARPNGQENAMAILHGVVVSREGVPCEGALVSLTVSGPMAATKQTFTDGNGRYNFAGVPPGGFKLTVSLNGFVTQTAVGAVQGGENLEVKELVLLMSGTTSEIEVTATPVEIAAAELKVEETQRVLGFLPNFYVSYAPHPLPLTRRQKFSLAWKTAIDPATFLMTGFVAGVEQATNNFEGYGQGASGYAKRYGAGYADGVIGTMIGAGVLASWWKQDPRYFYQGTGSKRSRAWHAISRAVLCNGDNGRTQVNYSAILGGLAAGGISNLYYPDSDRSSAGVIFENSLIGTAGAAAANLFQEFVVRRLTPKVPNYGTGKP